VAFNPRQALIIAAAVIVVAAGATYYVVTKPSSAVLDEASAATPAATPAPAATAPAPAPPNPSSDVMVAGPLGEMTLGDPKAPNVVIEYVSMTCPHCQRFHTDVYPKFKAQYIDTGKVYFLLREYPLDPLAAAAIVVARCAPKERFFPLVDLMFDHQNDWAFVPQPVDALFNLVKQAGFTRESFNACLTNQSLLDGVNWVQDRAQKQFGVGSTPTFFINGTKVAGEQTIDQLAAALKS
jgi:protein-disulfide isomerase